MKFFTALTLCLFMVTNLIACGTIIHPERKGQAAGQLDTGIVVLNAIGLLFYLVPGVIAFAVDFNNGSIYLPGGKSAQLSEQELEKISHNGQVDMQALQHVLSTRVSPGIDLSRESLEVKSLQSKDELASLFESHINARLASL